VKVSDEQLDQIREATNIVDLVSEHVRLKKRGRNYTGLCPFHNEKTPSFSVLEDKGIFKCFGCGKGGDVFSYVMALEGLSFPEAIERLAKRANIDIEPQQSDEEQQAHNVRESLYNTLHAAYTWYFHNLRAPEGLTAKEYLHHRGLESETIRKFGLGYAPERPGQLIAALTKQGYSTDLLEAAGLITRREGSDWYERFRGRVIFPVLSATGRVVGFGGRILPGQNKEVAKYINSPDTSVYHKSQILYGLFQAKDEIRRKGFAILVEGYADVIAVHQGAIENVVAASGTSLTVDQLNLLRRYTTSIVLLFDADTAGKNAAIRGIELAIEAGFDVNTVVLPAGEDPDSFIRQKGAAAFETAIEHRQSFIETKAQWFEEQGAFRDPGRMAGAIRSIVETISKVPDAIKRALFIRRLGERFHISEQMLSTELQNLVSDREHPVHAVLHRSTIREEEVADIPEKELENDLSAPVPRSEAAILEAMLIDSTSVSRLLDETVFSLDLITHPVVRELIGYLLQRNESNDPPDVASLLQEFRDRPEYERVLVQSAIAHQAPSGHWDYQLNSELAVTQARHGIAVLEQKAITLAMARLREQLSEAIEQRDIERLMHQQLELARRMQSLKNFSPQEASFVNEEHAGA
jgi:DNA primase